MAIANISGKLSKQVLKILDNPRDLISHFTHPSLQSPQMQGILKELQDDMHKAIKDNKVDEWLENAQKDARASGASDEKLKFLNATTTKQVLDHAVNLDRFGAEFGEKFLKAENINLDELSSKYGIDKDSELYKAASEFTANRQEDLNFIAKQLAGKDGNPADFMNKAKEEWHENIMAQIEGKHKIEVPEGAKTILTDGSNPADVKLEYNLWASLRGERAPLSDADFGDDVSDAMKQAYRDTIERAERDIVTEIDRRIEIDGGNFHDYAGQVEMEWVAKNDPNSPEYDPNFSFKEHKVEEPKIDADEVKNVNGVDSRFIKTKADVKFIEDFWAEVRGEKDMNLDDYKFQDGRKASSKQVSDQAQSYIQLMLERSEKEILDEARKLVTNRGGTIKGHTDEAREIWISKVDPTQNPNASNYKAPKVDMRVESAIRDLIEPSKENEAVINITRDTFSGMSATFRRSLKSGGDEDLAKIQRELIKEADKANNINAKELFSKPEFRQQLNVLSQTTRLKEDYWKALEDGSELSLKKVKQKYPDIDKATTDKIFKDFEKANETIGNMAKELAAPHTPNSFANYLELPRTEALDSWIANASDKKPEDLAKWLKEGAGKDPELASWMNVEANIIKLNDGIEPRKAEDFIGVARKRYVEEHNPNHVAIKDSAVKIDDGKLPAYEAPSSPSKGLPEFKPKITKMKLKMHTTVSDKFLFPTPKFTMYSAKAMLPQSKNVVDPVLKYSDQIMKDTGLVKSLQDLNEDILASYKESGDLDEAANIINNFANDEAIIKNLTMYRNKMQELRDHVADKFKTNKERFGTDDTTWKDDLTEEQKDSLLKYLDTRIKLAGDVSKGTDGDNGKEILKTLQRIQDGGISFKEIDESITGLSNSNYQANIAHTYLTDKYPQKLGGGTARWQFIEARTRAIEAGVYFGGQPGRPISKTFLVDADNNERASQNKFFERWLKRGEDGKYVTDWDNDQTANNFFQTLMPMLKTGYGQESIFNLQLLLKFKQRPGESEGDIGPKAGLFKNAVMRAKQDNPDDPFYSSPEFDFYTNKMVETLEKSEARTAGRHDTTVLTGNFGPKFLAKNRQSEWIFGFNSYDNYFATRYADFNRGQITNIGFGIKLPLAWAWMPPQSLPGNIQKKSHIEYWPMKIVTHMAGGQSEHGTDSKSLGVPRPDYESSTHTLRREIEGADGTTKKESRFNVAGRIALRAGSGYTVDGLTLGKGYFGHVKDMSWKKPTTLMNWTGLKMNTFGTALVGGSAVAGSISAVTGADYEGLNWWQSTGVAAGNLAYGFGEGAFGTLGTASYDEDGLNFEAGWLPKLGLLNLSHVTDLVTDYTIGGGVEGVYHSLKGDSFFDFNRKDDGWNSSQEVNDMGITYGSVLSEFLGFGTSSKPTAKTGNKGSQYTMPEGDAESLEEAKEMANDYYKAAWGKSGEINDKFNGFIISLDSFVNDRQAALDSMIAASVALGETEKVKNYTKLKTQLDETAGAFKAQIEADKIAVNKASIGILKDIEKRNNIAQGATHVIAANDMITQQKSFIKQLDGISDASVNMRMAELNAMTEKFDTAINSATPFTNNSAPVPRDLVAEAAAKEAAEAVKVQKAQLVANKEAEAEQKAADAAAKAELERIKNTPLGKAKAAAVTAMAAISANSAAAQKNATDAQELVNAFDNQVETIKNLKQQVIDGTSTVGDKQSRIHALDKILRDINEDKKAAAEKIEPLKAAAASAKEIELSAAVLIDEINNIPNDDNAVNTTQATERLADLQMQADISKATNNDSDSLIGEIRQLGTDNITAIQANPDFIESVRELSAGEFVAKGALGLGNNSPNSIPAMLVGSDGVSGVFGGVADVTKGAFKGFTKFWDDLERNTKSKEEQDWILIAKCLGLFGLGAFGMNKFNDWFMGGKMGQGWKFLGLATIGLVLMYKSGEWGDKMADIREGKSPFAQGGFAQNNLPRGTTTSESNSQELNASTGNEESPFSRDANKVVLLTDRNGNRVSQALPQHDDITSQGHEGKGLPRDSRNGSMPSDIEKALLASVTGKSFTTTQDENMVNALRNEGEMINATNFPYSHLAAANDAAFSIRA